MYRTYGHTDIELLKSPKFQRFLGSSSMSDTFFLADVADMKKEKPSFIKVSLCPNFFTPVK